jgi:hypothetical protein
MKPLFEMPELLTLNGDPFSGELELMGSGSSCQTGCTDGCCSGCDGGGGTGKKCDLTSFEPR